MTGVLKVDDIQDAGANSIVSSNGSGTLTFGNFTAATITASTALVPDASDGAALGTTALEWSDLFLADGAIINFGDDQEVTLTHTADTGITLNSTNKLMFNDASQFIQGASATVLDIAATDEIELTATLIDVVGNLAGSGTGTFGGILKTDDATDATSTTDGSLQTDGGLSVAKDTIIGNDLKLLSDSAVLVFGAGSDATLTHTNDTGLTLNSTNKLMFNDATQYIQGASGTVLDIAATDEIELTATLIEAVGRLEVTGGAIFNEASADVDFRIESNGNANAFVVDGGNDTVLLGNSTVQTIGGDVIKQQISGTGSASANLSISRHSDNNGSPNLTFYKSRNAALGNFTIVADNDVIGKINFQADDGTDAVSLGASIFARVNGTPGANDMPTELVFGTSPDGSQDITERLSLDAAGDANFAGNITVGDDKGITFGTGSDWHLAAAAGESTLDIFSGSDNTPHANDGKIQFSVGTTDQANFIKIQGGEGNTNLATLYLYGDQGDDTDDQWFPQSHSGSLSFDNNLNTIRQNLVFDGNGNGYADATWQDNSYDYAELFEWKTHLSNDSDINALWGKTVVLDGNKVKLAEDGDEANVIGIVRPKGSTNSHGDGLQWGGKWKKDVWGNYETENYTRVTWQENGYRHSYPKDRIPTHQLKMGIGEDKDIHKKESSFDLDKEGNKIAVVVPSTAEEKTATNYLERTHKKGKADVPLTRRIYNDSYNPATVYSRREDRLKEWVLIGMLGQVPVRDSTIIPTHWKKMKNLESGIDKYFIFNK